MDQAIHGVNNQIKIFSLSNYSLTSQIVIINFSTTGLALIFLIIFNYFLLSSEKNLNYQRDIINIKINQISEYLANNAIKRILTFDDSCNRTSEDTNRELARLECNENILVNKNYKDQLPQLDLTYTQQYIYSNFLQTNLNIKVISESWIKFADTNDVYGDQDAVLISDIDEKIERKPSKNKGFYENYQKIYFKNFNLIKKFFDKKKLNKKIIQNRKNDNIIVMETIKNKSNSSYIYKDKDNFFTNIFASPIIKDNKVYGVVLIDSVISFDDYQSASNSILLSNFFLFFITIMFFLSFLFSKSIVMPIKILSRNTNLERDKSSKNKTIIQYPNRNDEIGRLSKDIKSMSVDLKKRIKEIEEFASDVSHELKNPLAGLKSSSEVLKSKKLDEKNQKLLINNISNDIDRMNILISDISNYTLTQVEVSEEALEEVDIINFFYSIKNIISNKNFILEIKTQEKKICVKLNKNKFLQVINNLIDNSLTFVSKNSKILIFISKDDQNCNIEFVDQGPGILLDYKDKIFERFYTDRNDDRKSHSGLGLSISKNIIESFGGIINLVKSTHSGFEGACFEIKLPLKETSKNL